MIMALCVKDNSYCLFFSLRAIGFHQVSFNQIKVWISILFIFGCVNLLHIFSLSCSSFLLSVSCMNLVHKEVIVSHKEKVEEVTRYILPS